MQNIVVIVIIPQLQPYLSLKRLVWPVWYAWQYQTVDVMNVFGNILVTERQ